ncbi:hypothetical protein PILCRDRAFT_115522 [Piloderma croceum F 1598]|uniref:Uncharacterized protein n=1 Tax=Piloderma croceum (strain F 1598) TaxID=765440 RepID=A0A0C3C071_PILCF|nr:hypothetical protein PILCRDRAFT_115522 [Piloderma croceum F 1598]
MKSFATLMAMVALAGCALADNCTPGLNYCGSSLLKKGNYQAQIDQALADAGVQEVDNGESALFACEGGSNGVIKFLQECTVGECVDAGTGRSDYCG